MGIRIAYISDERFPGWGTDTQQINKNAEGLALAGAEVDLLIPVHVKTLHLSAEERVRRIRSHYGIGEQLNIKFVPGWPASDLRFEKLTHGLAAPLMAMLSQYDVMYTRNVVPTALALLCRRPTVMENHRILSAHYPVSYRVMRRLAAHRCLAGVITNCEYVRNSWQEMGVPAERLVVSHLGYDPRDFEPRLSRREARRELGWPEEVSTVVYTGHLGRGKGIEALHALAARMPDTHFRIVGGTPAQVAVRTRQAQEARLANVFHSPFVRIDQVPRHLYAGDALIVPPTGVPLRRYGNTVLPIKLYTYLAAGRPIVAPRLEDIEELIKDGENGVLVPPDDPDAAAARLVKVLASTAEMQRLEVRALELAPRFSWQNRGRQLLEFIQARLDATSQTCMGGARR